MIEMFLSPNRKRQMHFGEGETRLTGDSVDQIDFISLLEKSGIAQGVFALVQRSNMPGSHWQTRAFPDGLRAQPFLRRCGPPLLPI